MAKSNSTPLTDTPVYKLTNGICRWFLISLLWLLCSLPLVTAGAAACAALGEFSNPENTQQHKLIRDYFRRFGRCFSLATRLWLLALALLALLVLDVTFYQQFTGSTGWTLPVAALILGNLILGFLRFGFYEIAVGHKMGFKVLLKRAGETMLLCLPVWAIMTGMDLAVFSPLVRMPYFWFLAVLLPGLYANVHCMLIQRFLRRYGPEADA